MRKSTFSKILFACFAFVALACAPKSAFAQHGGGGHGGGGFHGGGGGFHVGGGFHGGAPGSNGVSRGRVGMAPSSSARFAPWATPRNFGNAAGRSSGTSVASAGHGFANADGQWHSFGRADNEPGPSVTARNFGNPAASTASVARGSGNVDSQWHSFGNAGNASVARASGASGPGGGAMAAKTQAPSLSAGSNRSLTMGSGATGSATKRWSGQGGDMWADNSRPTTPSSAMRTTSPGMTPNAPKAGIRDLPESCAVEFRKLTLRQHYIGQFAIWPFVVGQLRDWQFGLCRFKIWQRAIGQLSFFEFTIRKHRAGQFSIWQHRIQQLSPRKSTIWGRNHVRPPVCWHGIR